MSSVSDELAALRAKGSVKARASNLAQGGGASLSTPEAEATALRAKKESDRRGKSQAKEILQKGGGGAAAAEEAAQRTAQRKEELEKKAEASNILRTGGSAGGYSQEMEHIINQTDKKKREFEKKAETKREMAASTPDRSGSAGSSIKGAAAQKEERNTEETKVAKETTPTNEEPTASKKELGPPKKELGASEAIDDAPDLEEADEAVPELETAQTATTTKQSSGEEETQRQITNRNEKKARKMMSRLGMRPVHGIARATVKMSGDRGYFFLDAPDVFVSTSGKEYVMFGEARQGGSGGFPDANAAQAAQQRAAMAQQQAAMAAAGGMPSVEEVDEDVPDLEETAGEESVEAKDIELVMGQASCTRAKAVAALRENDGDLVNAIMSLTT
ncbi:hypothetical protein ACHAXT_002783 [Thalassiosira profunda]